jgi:hypothetical protein
LLTTIAKTKCGVLLPHCVHNINSTQITGYTATAFNLRLGIQADIMDNANFDSLVPELPALLHAVNSTLNQTFNTENKPQVTRDYHREAYLRATIGTLLLAYIIYQVARYLTSELPPFGSGLKPLPGPLSTLPYVGRVHDVDRMQAWTAFNKFSTQYNGLFSCTLGGETHIWVAREDVAQDLLVKHASISSARADLGAFPGVTEDYKYLPLLGLQVCS